MFKDIVGQNSAVKILEAAVKNKRWASSYLFIGPEGVGKKQAALSLAQALNCQDLRENESGRLDACGKCLSCRKVSQSNHPDVQVIVPEPDKASISIDQIRLIQKNSFFKPLEGRQKVYIIDDAGSLTTEAMNCFLKILEEPPSQVVFVLITFNVLLLLETIISRCQIIKFNNLPRTEVTAILTGRCGLSPEEASVLASISAGSAGVSLNYHDYGVVLERENMVKLLDEVNTGNISFLFREAERLSKDKDNVQLWLSLLVSFWRDIFFSRIFSDSTAGIEPDELLINRDSAGQLKDKLANFSTGTLKEHIELILHTKALIQRNVNPRLALETMFLNLTRNSELENSQTNSKE